MQKKIIALAVAAVASGAAFAQSNVTVYGVADLGQAYVKSSDAAVDAGNQKGYSRLDSNSSYIGFKGVEDLGNGLKAVFQFESGVAADTAGGLAGGRDTYVGLAGGFGTIAAGTLTHPLRAFGAKVDLLPGAAGFGTTASVTGTLAGIKTGADDRAQNAVAYISPSFSGFTVIGAYVNGEVKTAAESRRAWQIAAQYENGPLFVGAGYHNIKDNATSIPGGYGLGDGVDARVIRVAAVYTLPSATKLTALFDSTKVDGITALPADEVKRNAFSLGVAQGFGKNTIGLQYAQSMKVKADGDSIDGTQKKMATVLYSYELSKRTLLQARYSKLYNKEDGADLGNANFYNNPVTNAGTATQNDGADYSGFMVGVRHSF